MAENGANTGGQGEPLDLTVLGLNSGTSMVRLSNSMPGKIIS